MKPESVAEDIPEAGNIYSQSVDDPRDIYLYRDIAELADIQFTDLLQYNCSRLYNINTARSVAVQIYSVYYKQFPGFCT